MKLFSVVIIAIFLVLKSLYISGFLISRMIEERSLIINLIQNAKVCSAMADVLL